MPKWFVTLFVISAIAFSTFGAPEAKVMKNVMVYNEPGRFGGWPANHGIWSWGNEILVGFSAAYFQWNDQDRHPYDRSKPEESGLARSLDGGETWTIETPSTLPPLAKRGVVGAALNEPMDFTSRGFAMTLRFTESNRGPSLLLYSTDRGRSWKGPFRFAVGDLGIAARTDYIINGRHDAFVFLTVAKSNGREGRPVCAQTKDGGKTWNFVSWIGEEPKDGFSIMTSTVRLSKTDLLTSFRHEEDARKAGPNWIEAYLSTDNGKSWKFLSRPAEDTGAKSGNPPSMIRLRDGRICVTYGYRSVPYSIRARLSSDNGRTWGKEIILRDGGAAWDVGYSRTVQRPDGKIVTVYYWSPELKKERTIEATIWDPGK